MGKQKVDDVGVHEQMNTLMLIVNGLVLSQKVLRRDQTTRQTVLIAV